MQKPQGSDRASQEGKPPEAILGSSMDDIPEALRDAPEPESQVRWSKQAAIVGLVSIVAISLVSGIWVAAQTASQTASVEPSPASPLPAPPTLPQANATSSPTPVSSPSPQVQDDLLGHLPYEVAPSNELAAIVPDGSIKLRQAAAAKFREMIDAAQQEGISLVPISGFRTIEDQNYLFFEIKAQRGQVARQRAEVSAPPGYSEHHTGYAVDIGDANVPATNLSPDFENTAAFRWLAANAARYSFELSFPKDNSQGVSYEPWHWRYVGDRDSLETFYKARSLNTEAGEPVEPSSSP